MSDPKYLKCPCRHCGGFIEFPAPGIGLAVACPHCHRKTTLFAPPLEAGSPPGSTNAPIEQELGTLRASDEAAPATESGSSELAPASAHSPPRRSRLVIPLLVLFVLAAAGGGAWWWKKRQVAGESKAKPAPAADTAATPNAGGSGDASANTTGATAPVSRPKSPEDLKISAITLEKGKGNGLVHAVGTLRNDSEHQRFGLKLELALADARGQPLGTAKDYRAVLEPHQVWTFRALVLDPKAVSAQVSSLHEDE